MDESFALLRKVHTAARVANIAVRHPHAIPTLSCVSERKSAFWENAHPWWNSGAISYLARSLRPGDRVWEWGSGASTVWLVRHRAKVTSIENEPEWAEEVQTRCPGSDIRLIPGRDAGECQAEQEREYEVFRNLYYDDYLAAIDLEPEESLDVVIVDGCCRIECVRRAVPKVRQGGLIVLDDTERPYLTDQLRHCEEVHGWETVRKSGFKRWPLAAGLTETTFLRKPE